MQYHTQTKTRKILGMTVKQIVMLGGMAFVMLILVVISGYMALSYLSSASSPDSAVNQVPPSATPKPTRTPTSVPTAPPTMTPIPGWTQYQGKGLTLWLPEGWTTIDPAEYNAQAVSDSYQQLGPAYQQYAQDISESIGEVVFWAREYVNDSEVYSMSLIISTAMVPVDQYLNDIVDAEYSGLPARMRVIGRRSDALEKYLYSEQIITQWKDGPIQIKTTTYAIKIDDRVWFVDFVYPLFDFNKNQATIDLIAQSLELQP